MKVKLNEIKEVNIQSSKDFVPGTLYRYTQKHDSKNTGIVIFSTELLAEGEKNPHCSVIEITGSDAGHIWGVEDLTDLDNLLIDYSFTKFKGSITISN